MAITFIHIFLFLMQMIIVNSAGRINTASNDTVSSWIFEPPEIVIAVRGKPFELRCHSPLSNVTYHWVHNNHTLSLVNDTRRKVLPNGSLYFNSIINKKSGDAGSYRCIVQTPYGAISSKIITLQTAVLHDFIISPLNVTVSSEASRVAIRFSCNIYSIPDAKITWFKNGEKVPDDDMRYITKIPGVLYIKKIVDSDVGEYKCSATNELLNKVKFSSVGHLILEKVQNGSSEIQSGILPLAFISPESLEVKNVAEGDNITFECAAIGVSAPQLNWSFTSSIGNKPIILNKNDNAVSILSLTSVGIKDSGTYTCHAFQTMTGWPDFPHARVFHLQVFTTPSIVIKPETQTIPIANSIRFRCGAEGNPIPNITWYHNGHRLKLQGRIKLKDKYLLVSNTVSNDSGIYQCFASNNYGTVWAGAMLTISSSPYEPAPPINISCRTLSPTKIQVSWRKSLSDIHDDPPIIVRDDSIQLGSSHSSVSSSVPDLVETPSKIIRAYTIHYMPTDGGEESLAVSVNHSIIVDKLMPYKNYTFYVRVYNGKSGSDQSEKVTCKTQDEAPQTVPELTVTVLSPVSIRIEWSAIQVSLTNGAITQYQVMWRRLHSPSNYVQMLSKNILQYTITGLKSGGQYEVQVLGVTKTKLPDNDFSWQIVELPASNPNLPIPILSYEAVNSIKLMWYVTDQSALFDSYKLMYRTTNQTNQSIMTLKTFSPTINQHTINYLNAMDVYEILLNCVSESGEGEPVSKTISVVLDMLSPPSQIEAIAASLHTLNLSWVPPHSADPSSLLFIVSYCTLSNYSQNLTTVVTDLGATTLEINGLKPYSIYEFKISTQDKSNRKSEYSQKVQVRTLQGVPGIVEHITSQWLNASTVRISWLEPIKPNGIIMAYYVSYTSELNVPPTSWQQLNVSRSKNHLDLYGLNNNTRYFFMLRAATDAGFGPQSGIFSIEPLTPLKELSFKSNHTIEQPSIYVEDEQLLGIVIGCVIGVCCIIICTTSIVLKRQCIKAERLREIQQNSIASDAAYCSQHMLPITIEHVQSEESVPLNDIHYITRFIDSRGCFQNNNSSMAMPLLEQNSLREHNLLNMHIIENPQCLVNADNYDVDSLLSESAEGGAGTEESGCSDQLVKSQKGGDSSVIDDGFHEHVEINKISAVR